MANRSHKSIPVLFSDVSRRFLPCCSVAASLTGHSGTALISLYSSKMLRPLIIAIDGPSGSGKSTLGRMLARELGLLYIDTGSMYRAVALAVMESSVNSTDDVAVGSLAERIELDLEGGPDSLRVKLNGRDVTE